MNIADALPTTACDVLSKAADATVGHAPHLVEGSHEHFIEQVRDPLVTGSGCPYAPGKPLPPEEPMTYASHWPNVLATFPDRGIVHCRDCAKWWEVPFTTRSEDGQMVVETGEPQERVQAFISPEAAKASDHDGDEPSEEA